MSLVNDMLRDLDNRRKESGGTTASVKLTPAPEQVHELSKRPIILYLLVVLVIGAGAVAWFWSQQDGGNSPRQLDIAPQIVSEPPLEIPADEEIIEDPAESDLLQAQTADDTESREGSAGVVVNEGGDTSTSQDRSIAASDTGASESVSTTEEPVQIPNTEPADPPSIEDSELAETVANNSPESTSAPTQSDIVNLSEGPAQGVKNSAELTPDEKDLIAVQDALRLIAENKNADAYTLLEQEIINNRYAHQTRETYAKLLMNEGNLLGAYELTEAGLALSPNHSGFKKVKARLLIADGQLGAAVTLLLARAPEVSVDLEYHDILATAQFASRDYEGALISYTELVQMDQSQGKWWYGFAASQDSLGNANAARQGYSQAVQLPNLSANLRRRSQERLAILSQ